MKTLIRISMACLAIFLTVPAAATTWQDVDFYPVNDPDGYIDYRDFMIFQRYALDSDVRADLNGDGVYNILDLNVMGLLMGEPGLSHQPTSDAGQATIGIYFDNPSSPTLGIDNKITLDTFDLFSLHIVAHNLPEIAMISFTIVRDERIVIMSTSEDAGAIPDVLTLGISTDGERGWVRGVYPGSLGGGPDVHLLSLNCMFLGNAGDENVTIHLEGVDSDWVDPWRTPAYVDHETGRWTNFKTRTTAVINPNADWNKTYSASFHIFGGSTGADWAMAIRSTHKKWFHWQETGNACPDLAPPVCFVEKFADWINGLGLVNSLGHSISAVWWDADPPGFQIDNIHGQPFPPYDWDPIELGVGPPRPPHPIGDEDYCFVMVGQPCAFNPTLVAVGDQTSVIPDRTDFGLTSHPNPFNPLTTFKLSLDREAGVELAVFDLRGRQVRRLWSGQMAAGQHTIMWDGAGHDGQPLASGVYLVQMVTDHGAQRTVKVTLSR